LERWSRGDREALDQLLTHLYRDIHAIATAFGAKIEQAK
jgi:hypothetical protein